MPRSAYPAAEDLAALLAATGLTVPDALDFEAKVADAKDEWEQRTDWLPYLAGAEDSARAFDPPGYAWGGGGGHTMNLGAGLVSLTSVTIDSAADWTTNGVLTRGTDFVLLPSNATAQKRPYTSIRFARPVYGGAESVVILGRWGRVAELEDNVWNSILGYAASLCAPELGLTISGGLVKMDDATYQSGGLGPLGTEIVQWQPRFSRQAEARKRQAIF